MEGGHSKRWIDIEITKVKDVCLDIEITKEKDVCLDIEITKEKDVCPGL